MTAPSLPKAFAEAGALAAAGRADEARALYQALADAHPRVPESAFNLAVLDATAFALCRDQKLPINVFSIFKPGALKRIVLGEDEGTLVHS